MKLGNRANLHSDRPAVKSMSTGRLMVGRLLQLDHEAAGGAEETRPGCWVSKPDFAGCCATLAAGCGWVAQDEEARLGKAFTCGVSGRAGDDVAGGGAAEGNGLGATPKVSRGGGMGCCGADKAAG